MLRFGSRPSLAALLAMLAVTCGVAHAKSDPPARGARLGLAIHNLDDAWRESNAYQSSGVMVVGVDPRGRAAKSGIVAGDVLVRDVARFAGGTCRGRSLSPTRPCRSCWPTKAPA